MQITITEWNEEYKKLSNLYINEEYNLINILLKNDKSLLKIYHLLLNSEIEDEKIYFQKINKQLKLYINETLLYIRKKNITKNNYFDFQNKIKKINELFNKIKKDLKIKYDNLLQEEILFEKELELYQENFKEIFKSNEIENKKINKGKKIENLHLNIIEKYINNIINNKKVKEKERNDLNEIKNIINKLNILNIEEIIENIINIMEKKLGGINLGWQQKEQEEFLKLRKSYQNKINNYEFLIDLNNLIPYMTSNEHKNHILLFEKYCKLNEIKNLLIKKYKDLKYENIDIFYFKENKNQNDNDLYKKDIKNNKEEIKSFKKGNLNKTKSSKNINLKIKVHNYIKYNKNILSSPDSRNDRKIKEVKTTINKNNNNIYYTKNKNKINFHRRRNYVTSYDSLKRNKSNEFS